MRHVTILAAVTLISALTPVAHAQCDPDTIFRGPHPHINSNDNAQTRKTETADLNGDGILDLISMQNLDGVIVKLGNGDGTFGSSLFLDSTLGAPFEMAIGDVDGDTHTDIAVQSNGGLTDVVVFRGRGDGTFEGPRRRGSVSAGRGLAIGDVSQGGFGDIITKGFTGTTSTITVLQWQADATVINRQSIIAPTNVAEIALIDALSNDGKADDIVYLDPENDSVVVLLNAGVLPTNPDGPIIFAPLTLPTGADPRSLDVGDVNGDGLDDLIVGNFGSDDVSIYIASPDPEIFFLPEARAFVGQSVADVRVADVVGDTTNEIITLNNEPSISTVSVLMRDPAGAYTEHRYDRIVSGALTITSGDFDGDSDTDLVLANDFSGASAMTIMFNRCTRPPSPPILESQTEGTIITNAGSEVTLSIKLFDGAEPLLYQWRKNGTPIADDGRINGAMTETLTFSSTTIADTDTYDVVISNHLGTVTSEPVLLAVRGDDCPGDADNSGTVNFADLVATLFLFGECQ